METGIETKDINDFYEGEPASTDCLICGRGVTLTLDKIFELFVQRLQEKTIACKALKVKVRGSAQFGYIVMEADNDGNITPTYFSEEEYEKYNSNS